MQRVKRKTMSKKSDDLCSFYCGISVSKALQKHLKYVYERPRECIKLQFNSDRGS